MTKKKTVKRKKPVITRKKERMEPFGIRTTKALRDAIESDAKSRKPRLTPSDVAREVLEGHYQRKKKMK